MAKSSIERLPKPVKDLLLKHLRDNRLTLDEIIADVRGKFPDADTPSRSAVGRYKQTFEEAVSQQREMESMSELWIRELKDAPQGKTGRLVLELLRTLAARSAMDITSKDDINVKELGGLARAFNLIEAGGKREAENRALVREEVKAELIAEQSKVIDTVTKSAGLSKETADTLRRQILGIA